MSLLFIDSFDHYTYNSQDDKWDYLRRIDVHSIGALGRNGNAMRFTSAPGSGRVLKVLPSAQATLYVGVAMKVDRYGENAANAFFALMDGGTFKVSYALEQSGQISAWRGREQTGTLLGYTSTPLQQGAWYYFEARNTIDSNSGYVEVRLNGATAFTFAGNTLNGATQQCDRVLIGNEESILGIKHTIILDDLYVLDDTGAQNNAFLGDVRVIALLPNSDGDVLQWDPSTTGNNYQMVNETIPDSDRTYNSTSVTAERDLFHLADMGVGSAYVLGIQTLVEARQDDPSRTMRPLLTTNGSLYAGATVALTGSKYTFLQEIFELNPVTATSWTVTDIDSLQAGYELVA